MNEKLDPDKREFINKYLFIDGQYFLTKNWSFLKYREILTLSKLLELTLLSVRKIQNNVLSDNIILLWDSWPYRKTKELIEAGVDYKGDREFALDRIKEIKALLEVETDQEEVIRLQEELKEKERDHASFLIRRDAKKILKEWLPQIGIGSLSISGLEADDLACMASIWSPTNIDFDKNERTVICSSDSDWLSFCAPCTDFYRTTKEEEWLRYDHAPLKIPKKYRKFNINLYEYNLLHDAYYGNHNNLKKDEETVNNYTFSSVLDSYTNGDVRNIPYINKVFSALNIIKYYNDEIKNVFNETCLTLKPCFGAFADFCAENKIEISPDWFDDIFYYKLKTN